MEITVSYSDSTFGYISVSTSKVLAGMKHKKKKRPVYANKMYTVYNMI